MKASSTLFALIGAQTTTNSIGTTTLSLIDTVGDDSVAPTVSFDTLEDSALHCTPEGLSLCVPGIALRNFGFANNGAVAESFSIGKQWNENCTYLYADQADTDGQYYEYCFSVKHNECDIITTTNDTHIFYNGVLRGTGGYNNGVISREREYELGLECEFSRDMTVSIESFFTPIIRYVGV